MAKAVRANLKMKIPAGRASAAPPVGSTLGQYGVNMMDFINPFNDATKDMQGATVTAHITVYEDRTMTSVSSAHRLMTASALSSVSKRVPASRTAKKSARS
jgi:large subunit ribosomal protein L11